MGRKITLDKAEFIGVGTLAGCSGHVTLLHSAGDSSLELVLSNDLHLTRLRWPELPGVI